MDIAELKETLLQDLRKSKYAEKKIVFGMGPEKAEVVLVGEAPGGDEEKAGIPFVGKAGRNLNEFLQAINLSRDEIYITNAVKLRPTKVSPKTGKEMNRTPTAEEIRFFNPFLMKELELVSPEFVVTLGNTALNAVSDIERNIGQCHGRVQDEAKFKLFPLYHPAAIIYNRSLKEVYMNDLAELLRALNS